MQRRRIEAFLTLAAEEITAAERLRVDHPRQSIYFAQQAAEKLIRALLEVELVPAGKTHDLDALAMHLGGNNPFRDRFRALAPLSAASTRYRYPTVAGRLWDVADDELNEAIAAVTGLKAEVETWIAAQLGA
jgi:HEPN domain-containing protein